MFGNGSASFLLVRCVVLGAALGCLACNRHREVPVMEVEPHAEASARPPPAAIVDATAAAIEIADVQTFITTSGSPDHVRLFVANRTGVASTVRITGVDWVDASIRRPLTVRTIEVEPASQSPEGGTTIVVAAGGRVSVTVSFSGGNLPLEAAAYAFTVTTTVDGVPRDVDAFVRRARREPRQP